MQAEARALPLTDSRVALLLKWMLDRSKSLVPHVEGGKVTYPEVTKLIPRVNPVELLDRLAAKGLLKREYRSSEIICPLCGSSTFQDQYTCPSCRGNHLETGEMIEHYACGNVDFEPAFYREDRLVCSKCGRELKVIGTDYRRVGKIFKCNDCGRESGIPRIVHACQNCGTASTWEQIRLRILYEYKINSDKKKDVESLIGIHVPITEFLQKRGYKVESPAMLKGQSGTEHTFDMAAEINGKRTLIDIVTAVESVTEPEVIAFFAKSLDVEHTDSILVAVPKATEYAKALTLTYNIDLIEGKDTSQVMASMATFSSKKPTPKAFAPIKLALAPQTDSEASAKMGNLETKIGHSEEKPQEQAEETSPTSIIRNLRARISALEKEGSDSSRNQTARL